MGRKKTTSNIPSYDELIVPTVDALIKLGGSGSIEEINNKVYEITKLPDDILQIPHGEEGTMNEVEYRLAWSRTYLKKFGLLENSSRGIWALSKSNIDTSKLDYAEIVKTVREQNRESVSKIKKIKPTIGQVEDEIEDEVDNSEEWKEQLLNILYNITPAAFERLAQRLLR
jgi:restriction system protein